MEDKIIQNLENKVSDYKRFGFILLSLAIFLFIGLIVPSAEISAEQRGLIVAGEFITLGLSFFCHCLAMSAQKQLNRDNR